MEKFIDRLVSCGFSRQNAFIVCRSYSGRGDMAGLEEFVRNAEKMFEED